VAQRNSVTVVPGRQSGLAHAESPLQARCRGLSTETFYPPYRERGRTSQGWERDAKRICYSCPVIEACRRYAVNAQEPQGVWGATTPQEREALLLGGGSPGAIATSTPRPRHRDDGPSTSDARSVSDRGADGFPVITRHDSCQPCFQCEA
jgi:WhiB family redox-sensing transcriptional regulator